MRNVLLIDDEKLSDLLEQYCARYDIRITASHRPSAGMKLLRDKSFDAVILDVMLPEMDGFEVCKKIREFSTIPLIMLTARGEVTDRIVGLELGADDYLAKPFEPRELVARLNTIIKRIPPARSHQLTFQDLCIDTELRQVTANGSEVELTSKEYELLVVLASSPGQKFSRDEIMSAIRGTETEFYSRSIDILVSRLRSKLKPVAPIKTVHGHGYAFIAKQM